MDLDPVLIGVAFVMGFVASRLGLPPLAGFLVAGFVLHALGLQGGEALARVSDLGITLLLFTIGLKLDLASLLRREDRKLRIRQQYPSARRTATRALGIAWRSLSGTPRVQTEDPDTALGIACGRVEAVLSLEPRTRALVLGRLDHATRAPLVDQPADKDAHPWVPRNVRHPRPLARLLGTPDQRACHVQGRAVRPEPERDGARILWPRFELENLLVRRELPARNVRGTGLARKRSARKGSPRCARCADQ